jgi:hypothetical protein
MLSQDCLTIMQPALMNSFGPSPAYVAPDTGDFGDNLDGQRISNQRSALFTWEAGQVSRR